MLVSAERGERLRCPSCRCVSDSGASVADHSVYHTQTEELYELNSALSCGCFWIVWSVISCWGVKMFWNVSSRLCDNSLFVACKYSSWQKSFDQRWSTKKPNLLLAFLFHFDLMKTPFGFKKQNQKKEFYFFRMQEFEVSASIVLRLSKCWHMISHSLCNKLCD